MEQRGSSRLLTVKKQEEKNERKTKISNIKKAKLKDLENIAKN